MTKPSTEFDSPWKEMIENYFEDFMEFFYPNVYDAIDWIQGYEFLNQELQKVVREAATKKGRLVDKLVKVWRKDGKETLLYIHIEVQGQRETDFPKRIFTYHYRLYDRYGPQIISLVILGDGDKNWRPRSYGYSDLGCRLFFKFPIVKLLDYQDKWKQLEKSNNPFSIVVRTHLKGLETRRFPEQRYHWKVELFKALQKAKYSRQEILDLYHFLDWVLALPVELSQQFDHFVEDYEEAKKVRYITSIEKRWLEKGVQQGIQQGLGQGLQQGIGQGISQGLQLGLLQKSREDIREILALRFEHVPVLLISKIEAINDTSLLSKLHKEAVLVDSLETFEKLINKHSTH